MLKMAQKEYIKHLYEVEEKSLLEIANATGFNYRTVQKYAYQEDWSKDNLPNIEPTSYPVLESFIPTIDSWLEADRKVPRKQRHTVKRIYDRLRDELGFRGSYSSVKKYVRKKKFVMKAATEGYLPLAHLNGCGQVDFGEFIYHDAKKDEQTGYALTISFPNSNKGYTQAFPSQNQECLLTGMQRIFEHIGGVPPRLRFDNMTTAVAQVLEGRHDLSSFSKCPASLTGVIEHLFNALHKGWQHRFPEQGIQPRKEQSAQNNGNQNFDRGVNVALPGVPREDGATFGSCRADFFLKLAK